MSLFRVSDYATAKEKPKDQTRTGTKTRIPTQHRTPNLRCGICGRRPARRYPIGEKEVRILCDICVARFKAGAGDSEKPHFVKASSLAHMPDMREDIGDRARGIQPHQQDT